MGVNELQLLLVIAYDIEKHALADALFLAGREEFEYFPLNEGPWWK
jgi:hypothetical protein